MEKALKEQLEEIKQLRENLKKKGYHLSAPWKEVKKAIISNRKAQDDNK